MTGPAKTRIIAEKVLGKDLKPGELFSMVGPDYWDLAMDRRGIGERVYIRTNAPTSNAPDSDATVYRITIIGRRYRG